MSVEPTVLEITPQIVQALAAEIAPQSRPKTGRTTAVLSTSAPNQLAAQVQALQRQLGASQTATLNLLIRRGLLSLAQSGFNAEVASNKAKTVKIDPMLVGFIQRESTQGGVTFERAVNEMLARALQAEGVSL